MFCLAVRVFSFSKYLVLPSEYSDAVVISAIGTTCHATQRHYGGMFARRVPGAPGALPLY